MVDRGKSKEIQPRAEPSPLHASLTIGVCSSFSSTGPDVNQALVLEEKLASEAAVAPEPSCPQYPSPADADANDYVNYGFAPELAHGANAASSSLPKSDQKF